MRETSWMILFASIFAGVCLLSYWSTQDISEKRMQCEKKGGYFYVPYKSRAICLKSEDVLR